MTKVTGGLNTIVEVPSDLSDSLNLTSRSQDNYEHNENDSQLLGSDDQGSQYDSDLSLEDAEETARTSPRNIHSASPTPRRHSGRTSSSASGRKQKSGKRSANRRTPRIDDVDMTPPNELLETAERKAKKYMAKKKANEAVYEQIRCIALNRMVYGDGHWKLARAHSRLAEGYFDLKGYAPQSEEHANTARNIMMSGVQLSSSSKDKHRIIETLVSLHYTLGRAQAQQKKYAEAETALHKALKLHKEQYSKHTEVPQTQLDDWDIKLSVALGKLSARQRKQASAQQYFEAALRQMRKRHGKDSVELIPIYQALGRVEQSKGDHADHEIAIEHFLQAYSIASAKYRDGNETVAETAVCLANSYSNVGQTDADLSAESYYNDAVAMFQKVHGPFHEKTISVQDDLAKLMIRTDKQQDGIDLLKSTLEAKKEVHGEYSVPVTETWKLIGNVYLAQGEMEKALRALKKCHNIECSMYGVNDKKSKDTQRTIDILLANPNIPEKHKKSKANELKERPRFNSIVNRGSAIGGVKTSTY